MGEGEQDRMLVNDEVHTSGSPYCSDPGCWCHIDMEYHDWVQRPGYSYEDVNKAYGFYEVYH